MSGLSALGPVQGDAAAVVAGDASRKVGQMVVESSAVCGCGRPKWVNLTLAAYAQLRMASALVDDLRRPWHPKPELGTVLSPYRTRLGFRRLRARLGSPTKAAKFSRPGAAQGIEEPAEDPQPTSPQNPYNEYLERRDKPAWRRR